jgi:hypothetical protein
LPNNFTALSAGYEVGAINKGYCNNVQLTEQCYNYVCYIHNTKRKSEAAERLYRITAQLKFSSHLLVKSAARRVSFSTLALNILI